MYKRSSIKLSTSICKNNLYFQQSCIVHCQFNERFIITESFWNITKKKNICSEYVTDKKKNWLQNIKFKAQIKW